MKRPLPLCTRLTALKRCIVLMLTYGKSHIEYIDTQELLTILRLILNRLFIHILKVLAFVYCAGLT